MIKNVAGKVLWRKPQKSEETLEITAARVEKFTASVVGSFLEYVAQNQENILLKYKPSWNFLQPIVKTRSADS